MIETGSRVFHPVGRVRTFGAAAFIAYLAMDVNTIRFTRVIRGRSTIPTFLDSRPGPIPIVREAARGRTGHINLLGSSLL
jgi:hypothetical protein